MLFAIFVEITLVDCALVSLDINFLNTSKHLHILSMICNSQKPKSFYEIKFFLSAMENVDFPSPLLWALLCFYY